MKAGQANTRTAVPNVAEALVAALHRRGVRRIFGVPGGGSSLDIIAATEAHGIDFVLTQTETAAAIMAAVTAELSGAPGVVITGVGPGAASAVNGVAYAALERAPVLLVTDCAEDGAESSLHQKFDQGALFAPLAKATRRLRAEDAVATVEAMLDTAMTPIRGPVHLDLSARQSALPVDGSPTTTTARPAAPYRADSVDGDVAAARSLLSACRRPVIVAGLHAREAGAAAALRGLLDGLDCPLLTTYKAKGVVPDRDPRVLGAFTGGTAEADCLNRADAILFYGVDPIEPISRVWPYQAPLLEMATGAGPPHAATPAAALTGPLAACAEELRGANAPTAWTANEIAALREAMRSRLAIAGSGGHGPQAVVEATQRAAPGNCRITVDSGAHMFSAMAFWHAERPFDVLKSNGLSTMAFALPAAIAAALQEPERPVVTFTGDAGLMMCLSELATAARLGCRIVVVAFNDAALSLIDIKQQNQGRASRGVRYPSVDLAAAARGLGCHGWRVEPDMELAPILARACAAEGPAVVDVVIDPSGYAAQLAALRE